jgi:hypothetical protein
VARPGCVRVPVRGCARVAWVVVGWLGAAAGWGCVRACLCTLTEVWVWVWGAGGSGWMWAFGVCGVWQVALGVSLGVQDVRVLSLGCGVLQSGLVLCSVVVRVPECSLSDRPLSNHPAPQTPRLWASCPVPPSHPSSRHT